jgi:hypothetical protein
MIYEPAWCSFSLQLPESLSDGGFADAELSGQTRFYDGQTRRHIALDDALLKTLVCGDFLIFDCAQNLNM